MPVRASKRAVTNATLEPCAAFVDGDSAVTTTNGSSRYALVSSSSKASVRQLGACRRAGVARRQDAPVHRGEVRA